MENIYFLFKLWFYDLDTEILKDTMNNLGVHMWK